MFNIQNYILQHVKEPVFSNTRWAATTLTSVDVDETANGASLIYCFIAIINSVNAQELRLIDNFGTYLININVCNVNALQQFPITHIMKASKVTFSCSNSNGFSIGYQYITDKQK